METTKTEHQVWEEENAAWERDLRAFVRERMPSEIAAPPTARYGTPPAKAFDPGEF